MTPVQPRCVKPMMVPNLDPGPAGTCPATGLGACNKFVSPADGSIVNGGIVTSGGVIGETFTLFANCGGTGPPCGPIFPKTGPLATIGINVGPGVIPGLTQPNLEYLPGQVLGSSVAVPAGATAGTGGVAEYIRAIGGCDQSTDQNTASSTVYQCGIQSSSLATPNAIDLSENPGGNDGDTAVGLAALATGQASIPLTGEDTLDTTAYPFKIIAGNSNPRGIPARSQVTASNQVITLPLYDTTQPFAFAGTVSPVTIVGFLQVFVNRIDPAAGNGNINVTVLNVVGCGSGATTTPNPAVAGSSPVPVRLITPQ